MSVTPQQLVNQKVKVCFDIASAYFNKPFAPPLVLFKQRGKIAGCARLQTNELRFNPILLADNTQVFLDEVVPHEVCHLLAYQLYGRVKPHGKEWQTLMIELFARKPSTFHQMDVHKVAGETFKYQCQCDTFKLSVRRHNKVLKGQQKYVCRKCNTTLIADAFEVIV